VLERYELEAFLMLAEELHFGRTADRLHVSTARVSQTIKKLERRMGVSLFHRTSRRVELTAVGRQLYEDVRPAWRQISEAFERAVEVGKGATGTVQVAFTGDRPVNLLPQQLTCGASGCPTAVCRSERRSGLTFCHGCATAQ
jgi:DNA-binding transcriptional LysR family regulator